ncbi:MAG: putative selenate reductase subunit YgfK, partial [Oscillospiraceae bacterium]
MGDLMRRIPFNNLMDWVMDEYKTEKKVFGVYSDKFYKKQDNKLVNIFKEKLETVVGPAAGPNTQLSQNIIASYLAGSRFFELKTVQIMDGAELSACVSKPCILADDEGYNCEWSTELYVPEAFEEYVKAWFALKVISQEFGLGDKDGFVFNMSVGYDLDGIKSPKVDKFINEIKDASNTPIFKECQEWLLANIDKFEKIDADFVKNINPHVCTSITLSTLHGCPPKEIEKIASYLITEKNLNTFVKCNPTLLGYEYARKTVDALGYDYIAFGPLHFEEDMQFCDCVPMIGRLKAQCEERGLEFGVKLTNTFPVDVTRGELPSNEMYMSGRILYPLVMNLAYKLAKEFDGNLRMSMSGGADFYNVDKIFNAGIYPITMATTILKPGGYLRLQQIAKKLENNLEFNGVDMAALKKLAEESLRDPRHLKARREAAVDKMKAPLPLIDCYAAPCHESCPINQNIPEYVKLVGEHDYLGAMKVIAERNPMPFTTGTICPHTCQNHCTRNFYDESVAIRDAKLKAATEGYDALIKEIKETAIDKNFKVAVIGAGPAGLAAAYHLRRNGVDVTVFDSKKTMGGIVTNVIPEFRVENSQVEKDINLVKATGVKFELGVDPNFSVADLKSKGFNYVFLAVGTWKHGDAKIAGNGVTVVNVLDFLAKFNETKGENTIGKNVIVIGGGNSAMDAARAAKR